jgi:hypothetical protein
LTRERATNFLRMLRWDEVVVLPGEPENLEQGVLFGKSRRNCTAWTGVIFTIPFIYIASRQLRSLLFWRLRHIYFLFTVLLLLTRKGSLDQTL